MHENRRREAPSGLARANPQRRSGKPPDRSRAASERLSPSERTRGQNASQRQFSCFCAAFPAGANPHSDQQASHAQRAPETPARLSQTRTRRRRIPHAPAKALPCEHSASPVTNPVRRQPPFRAGTLHPWPRTWLRSGRARRRTTAHQGFWGRKGFRGRRFRGGRQGSGGRPPP